MSKENKRCPCCGISSSAGIKANEKYYDLLYKFKNLAKETGNQAAMVSAAKEYMSNVITCVSCSDRPTLIPYEKDISDLREAYWLLGEALEVEKRIGEKND